MVKHVPTGICKEILKSTPDTQDIFVGSENADGMDGSWYLGDNENICDNGNKDMLFALSPEILSGFDPDGEDTCQDWCGETPLVGSCWVMNEYCKNQGGRATIYQLILISDNPLYCKTQREAGKEVVANYYSTPVYTYTGNCPTTDKYKGLWSQLRNTCSDRQGRYISNVDRVEVNRSGSLTGSECGSSNWWSSGACYDDVQAIIDAYDAANP
ncbi:MAG: hypothetical protein J6V11_00300 [Alphaproteobacteria bacterium]|nr:hypothetical protein [Alphaproteobacteria bacterium]